MCPTNKILHKMGLEWTVWADNRCIRLEIAPTFYLVEKINNKNTEKNSSRNWGLLVWKLLGCLVGVLCTRLEVPNSHIVKNMCLTIIINNFIFCPIGSLFRCLGSCAGIFKESGGTGLDSWLVHGILGTMFG